MGGFFGVTSKQDCMVEVFYGTDYHSHLGTKRGGLAIWSKETGIQRDIHNIENSPFRTKFNGFMNDAAATSAIGCISDSNPQPLLVRSKLGTYAISTIGIINNSDELIDEYLKQTNGHFEAMSGGNINATELTAALINTKDDITEGIKYAQDKIIGTSSILILKDDGHLIAARDKLGRLPIQLGQNEDGFAASFESFPLTKLGFEPYKELGPGEIVEITPDEVITLQEAGEEMKICSFLWSYYGYPSSSYEGINVETMRIKNGEIMAKNDGCTRETSTLDFVGGVPDSGVPHAIGYATGSGVPFRRAFIKYTPTWARSFMPQNQKQRNRVAKMKQTPVVDLIKDNEMLFVDDSIVRGTQLRETVEFLYENGAKAVHMRSACPPIMYGCKYLSFSRNESEMDLIARRVIVELEGEEGLKYIEEYTDGKTERGKKLREVIADKFNFASLDFQTLEGLIEAIGLPECKLCTYCWNGKE